jgi:2-aminoadipate transaminase
VIEDDVYRELTFDAPGLPALGRSPGEEPGVLRLGSFAKLVAPGLRVGWIAAPRERIDRLAAAGWLDSGGGASHFTAMVLATMGPQGAIDRHVALLRTAYAARRDALAAALREALPAGSRVATPGGGFFIWATLPGGADAAALLPRAEAAGVGYVPGARFGLPGAPVPHASLRVAFCGHPEATLSEGARRLGRALAVVEVGAP